LEKIFAQLSTLKPAWLKPAGFIHLNKNLQRLMSKAIENSRQQE
jgi:hypothetical protein